jgi:predicted nucleic acid-binding protein
VEPAVNAMPPRVYLDTNVFIAAYETTGAHSDHAWWLLDALERGDIIGATSELTLSELLVRPIEEGADDLAEAYDGMIRPAAHFDVLPVGRDILIAAARLRARRSATRLPDAVHLASAERLGCRIFISRDKRLRAPEGMRVIGLDPFTLDDLLQPPQ